MTLKTANAVIVFGTKKMKKIFWIIIALFLAAILILLIIKGVCMPFIFWLAIIWPLAWILVVKLGFTIKF
jgi:hypothetical protein